MTSRSTRRALSITGAMALTLAAALTPQAAFADTTDSFQETGAMNIVGYDEAVAAANGFEIVTDENGDQSSVPVTDEAKAHVAHRDTTPEITPLWDEDVVEGNCGISYVGGEKGANDQVSFETGYVVIDAVVEYTWTVNAQGFISGDTFSNAGNDPDPEYFASGVLTAIGPGVLGVPAASAAAQVILIDGSVCFSGGPSVSFP